MLSYCCLGGVYLSALKEDNFDIIKNYLKQLNRIKLLTKADEVRLFKAIEFGERELLKVATEFPPVLKEIVKIKEKILASDSFLIDSIRGLDGDSSRLKKTRIRNKILRLIKKIELYMECGDKILLKEIAVELPNIKFITKAIKTFVNPIKALNIRFNKLKTQTQNNFKALRINSIEDYNILHEKCLDSTCLAIIARQYNLPAEKLNKYFRDQEAIFSELISTGLHNSRRVKSLIKACQLIEDAEKISAEAKNTLVESNLRLVVSRAKKYNNKGLYFEDLLQEGSIGLIKAIDKFDYRHGHKFSTYATWWVEQTLGRSLANNAKLIRLPVHMVETVNKIKKLQINYYQKNGKDPSPEELAFMLNIPVYKVRKALNVPKEPLSVETPINSGIEEGNSTLVDILSDSEVNHAYNKVANFHVSDKIRVLLSKLPPRDEKIIRLRFGIGNRPEQTLSEIGEHFNISRERVRQLQNKALKSLKNNIRYFKIFELEK